MDGTHVSVWPPKHATQAYRSRKATVTTNVLCVCNMDMQFIYVHVGWEGSANDSRMLEETIGDPKHTFPWPPTSTTTNLKIYQFLHVFVIVIVANFE